MGYVPQILLMIFFIIFLLIASHCTSFNADGLKEVVYYSEEDNGSGREQHIEKVAGQDENEVKKAIIFEKIRSLLGLKNNKFHIRRKPSYGSPSPSPLPATIEPPAEPPVLPIHHAHLHHRPRLHRQPPPHKEERQNGGSRRILVAVLVSTGGATFVLCAIGLIWGCGKFRKQRRRSTRTVSIIHNIGSKYVSRQNSVKKVTSDPGPDLFYLDSLGTALEPQPFCFKPDTKTIISSSSSNQNIPTPHEVEEESEDKLVKSESNSVGEIMSDHESVVQSIVDDEVVIPVEADSSDDESFHSVCNSHSTDDTSEIASPNLSNVSSFSVNTPINLPIPWQTPNPISSLLTNSYSHAPPPPPPPPPPSSIPSVRISPSHSCSTSGITSKVLNSSTLSYLSSPKRNTDSSPSHSCSTSPTTSKDMNSSTLQNLSSPKRNTDSSPSGSSNKTTRSDSAPKPPILIPPPPCPPPSSKGNVANSLKGPPPPPPQFTPFRKGGSPLPKLKPLHWDKVRAAPDRSMVWDKLRSNSFEFDEKMIESLFGYNLQNSMKNEEAKSKTPSPGKHVLEPKRLQNITILSKALNATPEQVCDALMQGGGLSLQQLEALVKMEPTKDEQAKLTGYKGDANELGSAERFVKAILKIPFAFSRIEAMLYRETFEDEVVHLRKSFSMLEEACKELRSSRLFLKLLEAVLKTGNRMNVGTIRGGARAFKLDALLKLADVKGTDGKTTLLHFVVQEIVRSEGIRVSESIIGKINQKSKSKKVEDREEDYRRMGLDLVSGLCTELCNVKKTATVDLDVLASSVTNLSDGMTKLQHLVLKDLSVEEKSGNFVHSMKSFICYAGKNLMELQEDEHRVLLHVREITEYFHGNLNKDEVNPLRIFVIVRDFLGMLDHVCKELRSSKVLSNPNPLSPFR